MMTPTKMNGLTSAIIGATLTLLITVVGFMMTFSAVRQEVANLREDFRDQTMILRSMQEQQVDLIERLASLEAKFCVLVPGAAP